MNQARTEADLIGVRMPWRKERGFDDDPLITQAQAGKMLVYLAEVKKSGMCTINGPWSRRSDSNINRAIEAVGCIPNERVAAAANKLYENCFYEDEKIVIRLVAFASETNVVYEAAKEKVIQITWRHTLRFIHSRFEQHRVAKADHGVWPETGLRLWEMSKGNSEAFERKVIGQF